VSRFRESTSESDARRPALKIVWEGDVGVDLWVEVSTHEGNVPETMGGAGKNKQNRKSNQNGLQGDLKLGTKYREEKQVNGHRHVGGQNEARAYR